MTPPASIEVGHGRVAVLLLHGIGGGQAIWGESASGTVQALAAAGYRALALDFPGYGAALDAGPPTLPAMVGAVREVIDARLDGRWVLVGHSMGGMVAQELLARERRGVDGLVLACTSAAFGSTDGAWQARFVADRLAPLDAGLGMPEMARRLVPTLVAAGAAPAALDAAVQVMAAVPEASYRAALQAIVAFDRRAALADIGVPTLLLAAEHDRTAPPAVMQRMAQRIPGAEYLCLEGAGHIANVERPAAFNGALLSFLRRHF